MLQTRLFLRQIEVVHLFYILWETFCRHKSQTLQKSEDESICLKFF